MLNTYIITAVLAVIALMIFKKNGSFFKSLFTSALGGVGSLCAVGALSYFMPLSIGINPLSLIIAALYSVPGVILMLLAETFIF